MMVIVWVHCVVSLCFSIVKVAQQEEQKFHIVPRFESNEIFHPPADALSLSLSGFFVLSFSVLKFKKTIPSRLIEYKIYAICQSPLISVDFDIR